MAWLNDLLGQSEAVDDAVYLLVSDCFVPLCICFWMLLLWIQGRDAQDGAGINGRCWEAPSVWDSPTWLC